MQRFALFVPVLLACLPCPGQGPYPATRTVAVSDTYFGMRVDDPYRWLESLRDREVQTWFRSQADLGDRMLAQIPGRDALAREWMELDRLRAAQYSSICAENGQAFFRKTLGEENVGRLFRRQGWDGADQLLFDPASYRPGVTTTIHSLIPSSDGRFVALSLSSGGAEYSEIRVLDVERRKLLPDRIAPSFGAIGWTPDSGSFFYDGGPVTDTRSSEFRLNRQTRLHRLGTPVLQDRDVFSNRSDPALGIAAKERPTAFIAEAFPEYLVGRVSTVQKELRLFLAPASDLERPSIRWISLCVPSDKLVRGLTIHGDQAYAITHAGAPNYKVVRTSLAHPDWSHAETVVPEGADCILSMTRTRDFIFLVKSNGITDRLFRLQPATGRSTELALPGSGTVQVSCPDIRGNRCLVSISSWIRPTTLYDLDGARETFAVSSFDSTPAPPGFEDLLTEEVEVPGHDGTRIPLSIVRRRDLPLDGTSSCILAGYGAYGAGLRPGFSVLHSLARRGVVFAYAHPRGGDEKGEAWYKAGFQVTKPNTWKDYISCAEYLVGRGYTSPAHLGGIGTSAGGILITRAITERPDLFAAAVCNVGCANTMRLEFCANGPVNTPEFGSVQDPVQCKALFEMDGLQHVRPGTRYPAILGVAGWNDPRVPPWQPGKFVAAMQQASSSGRPALLKVNYNSGHFSEEKVVAYQDLASQYAFLLWQTGHRDFQPASAPAPEAPGRTREARGRNR